jgi:intracellular multiplication protein IcmJ
MSDGPVSHRRGMLSLRLLPEAAADARGSNRPSPFWRVAEPVKAAVWRRDGDACRLCGFRSARHQEVLVLGRNARDPGQMITICPLCHQCLHLGEVVAMRSGLLIWLPELAQAELHRVAIEIYVTMLTRAGRPRAQRLLEALLARREGARERLGSDDPAALVARLRAGEPPDPALADGLRLLPLDRRILRTDELEFNQFPQMLAFWRSPQGPYGAGRAGAANALAWLALAESVLWPVDQAAGRQSGPAGEVAAAGPPPLPAEDAGPPPTAASLAAKLLEDAATFFRGVAEQNPGLADQMIENARVYEQVAELLRRDPATVLDVDPDPAGQADTSVAALGVRLLRDAAAFFESVAEQNLPLAEQMTDNAEVYRQLAERLADDPLFPFDE